MCLFSHLPCCVRLQLWSLDVTEPCSAQGRFEAGWLFPLQPHELAPIPGEPRTPLFYAVHT